MPTGGVDAAVENVFGVQYEQEFVMDFGQKMAVLPQLMNTSGVMMGSKQCQWGIVADDGGEGATRVRGEIPYDYVDPSAAVATVASTVTGRRVDDFDAFRAHIDIRKALYDTIRSPLQRRIDQACISALDETTHELDDGSNGGITLTKSNALSWIKSFRELIEADYSETDYMIGVLTEAAFLQLENIPQASSRDFVNDLPFATGKRFMFWQGIYWTAHPRLPGRGGTASKNYLFLKRGVGCKMNDPEFIIDYNKEHKYHYANGEVRYATKLLLTKAVYRLLHNDQATFG